MRRTEGGGGGRSRRRRWWWWREEEERRRRNERGEEEEKEEEKERGKVYNKGRARDSDDSSHLIRLELRLSIIGVHSNRHLNRSKTIRKNIRRAK